MEQEIFQHFHQIGIIPVLEIDSVDCAAPTAEALLAGGLPLAEVTLQTEAAIWSIETIARDMPGVIPGAGTVLNRSQARTAHDAGTRFLVCPGMVEEVVIWAQEHQVPVLAGAVTLTEMIRGLSFGLQVLKFFPAEAMGGIKAIKATSDPFPQLRFIPTGGINPENAGGYLNMEKIHAVGGSWMAKREMINGRQFDEIACLAGEASQIVKQVRGWIRWTL